MMSKKVYGTEQSTEKAKSSKSARDMTIWDSSLGNRQKFVALGMSMMMDRDGGDAIPEKQLKEFFGGSVSSDEYPFVSVDKDGFASVDWDMISACDKMPGPKNMTMSLLEGKVIPAYNQWKPSSWKTCRRGNNERVKLANRMYQDFERSVESMLENMELALAGAKLDPYFSGQSDANYIGEFDRLFYKNRYHNFIEAMLEQRANAAAIHGSGLSVVEIGQAKTSSERRKRLNGMGMNAYLKSKGAAV